MKKAIAVLLSVLLIFCEFCVSYKFPLKKNPVRKKIKKVITSYYDMKDNVKGNGDNIVSDKNRVHSIELVEELSSNSTSLNEISNNTTGTGFFGSLTSGVGSLVERLFNVRRDVVESVVSPLQTVRDQVGKKVIAPYSGAPWLILL